MRKILSVGVAAVTLAAGVMSASASDARDYRDGRYYRNHGHYQHYRRDRDDDGAAIAAGVVGLALGAALASGGNDRGYYDRGYYDRRYYDRGHYYAPPRYRTTCRVTRTWDPYYGGYVRRERCW